MILSVWKYMFFLNSEYTETHKNCNFKGQKKSILLVIAKEGEITKYVIPSNLVF